MKPIGVIFDMDGVLVDSGAPHAESWRQVAVQHDIHISDAEFKRTFGRPSRDIVRIIWGAHVTDAQIAEIDEEKEAAYRDLVRGAVPLMPGVRELLAALDSAGMPLAVATSGPRENVDLVLDETDLRRHFGAIVTGFDVRNGKPAPDCFLLAAERIGVAPAACVVVEDAPVGIQAARNAGMKSIALTGTHPAERLREVGPGAIVARLDEITLDSISTLVGAG